MLCGSCKCLFFVTRSPKSQKIHFQTLKIIKTTDNYGWLAQWCPYSCSYSCSSIPATIPAHVPFPAPIPAHILDPDEFWWPGPGPARAGPGPGPALARPRPGPGPGPGQGRARVKTCFCCVNLCVNSTKKQGEFAGEFRVNVMWILCVFFTVNLR